MCIAYSVSIFCGFETTLKELHQKFRLSYLPWCWSGKAKDSPEHMKNKELKKNFRRQLRAAAHAQEETERLRIDELVDADHCLFGKAVNSKNLNCKKQGSEVVFYGTRYCTVDGIPSGWQGYFSDIYTPSQNPYYDDDHMRFVNCEVSNYLDRSNEHPSDSMLFYTCNEVIQTLLI